jgi:outer membrane protein
VKKGRGVRHPAWVAIAALAATLPSRRSTAGEGLSLAEVVDRTLAASPEIQLAVQESEALRGSLAAAGAPFDLVLQSSGGASRLHTPGAREGATTAAAMQDQLSLALGAQRRLRNGVLLHHEVGLTRTDLFSVPGAAPSNVASVALSATVPVLRDRGGVVTAASERAARFDYEASLKGLQHTVALRVLAAVIAYWDYVSAQRRLEVFRSSQERAERTVEQTRVLVQAEERTTADLTQIRGNLAAKRVSRIAAEQAVIQARQQLGLVMGLPAEDVLRLPPPVTLFPGLDGRPARAPEAALLAEAYARRADLMAAEQDLLSAETRWRASESELRPRLDLVFSTGYNAAEPGRGVGDFFQPLDPRGPRMNRSFSLRYEFPAANSLARGRLLQTSSAYNRQRIFRDDLRRRVSVGVEVAAESLRGGEAGMRDSEEAVRLLESTVEAEQRKFQLGVATLFDVIQAQDGLTAALLGQTQSQRNYAVAIAILRFESGTLLRDERGRPAVDAAALETPP